MRRELRSFVRDRPLIWLVAMLASLEALGEAVTSLANGFQTNAIVWMVVVLGIAVGTITLENLKDGQVP